MKPKTKTLAILESTVNWKTDKMKENQYQTELLSLFHQKAGVEVALRGNNTITSSSLIHVFLIGLEMLKPKVNPADLTKF